MGKDAVEKPRAFFFRSPVLKERYERVVGKLQEVLAAHFEGGAQASVVPLRLIHRPFSDLVRCQAHSGSQSLGFYIKFVRLAGKSEEEDGRMIKNMEREIALIRRLSKNFPPDAALAVPNILADYPEEQAVVTEESPGLPLLARVAKSARGLPGKKNLEGMKQHCRAAGAWLKKFHAMPPLDLGRKESPDDLIAYVRLRLEKLWKTAAFNRRDAESILSYIQEQLDACAEDKKIRCGTHGDFSLSNILAAQGRITVLDFGMYHQASPYLDVSYFCQHMDDFLTNPLFIRSTTSALNDAFLEGYSPDFDREHPLYRAYYVRHMVNHLVGLSRFASLSPVKRLYQKQQYRQCLSSLRKVISKR